jgi:uncharacterized protein YndB with AHSA1/START domain
MLVKIIIAIVVVIAAIVIYASTKPDNFHVERSITIKAPPEKIFPLINDFHAWNDWTPYNKDPAMKKTYSGSDQGVGAAYAWEGNKEVGRGDITITGTTPPNKIEFDLHMIEPFEGHNKVAFTLTVAGDSTQMTWSLDDKQKLMVKVMGMFMDMDLMIGKDFEVGLLGLKTLVERQ